MIEHILKLKYCTNNRNHKVWINSIKTHKGTFSGYVKWRTRKAINRLIDYVSENIADCYEYGIILYNEAAKEYPDLVDGLSQIPEECPWKLDELMDGDIDYLLEKLDKKESEEYE